MPTLEVTVQVKIDGMPVAGFPLSRRVSADESQSFAVEIPVHGSTGEGTIIPLNFLDSVQSLVLTTDRTITVALNGGLPSQGFGCPTVSAGGLLIILNGELGNGSSANSINNLSGATANIRGIGAGT